MKQLKKLLAGALATAVSAVCMLPFMCSAASLQTVCEKDPNGDGKLNMADVAYIIQCLGGYYIPSDYTQLDMDNNGLVTQVDAIFIQCLIATPKQ